jgi:hypothetical protein
MITLLLIGILIYFLLGYGAYKQSEKKCKTAQDKKDLKSFKNKLYLNWVSYAIFIGKLRQHIKNVKETEKNTLEQTYKGDPDKVSIELFSNGFQGSERRGSAIFASYIVNPMADDK